MIKVYNFDIELDWKLVNILSELDRFDASWSSIEKREEKSLKQLKKISTVRSVGASTRIEGSKMSDAEVDQLLKDLTIDKLTNRDKQEVAGYFEVMDFISETYSDIQISEGHIKNLHKTLLKHSDKDHWHNGDYKKHSNSVEASFPDGSRQIIFETTSAGRETEEAMKNLCLWYETDQKTHSLVKSALFSYEFVSIHPFQDGNGRMSRLLATLLLLKNGYKWIQYVSLEHEIESRKVDYYRQLRNCQANRPNENITSWLLFFFDALRNVQIQLTNKLEQSGIQSSLSSKKKAILLYITDYPSCQSGAISTALEIPSPTIKKLLKELKEENLIVRQGKGRATSYRIV